MERKVAPKRNDTKRKHKSSQFDYMEVYRQLRTNIEYSSFNKDVKVVNITAQILQRGKALLQAILQWFRLPNIQKFY